MLPSPSLLASGAGLIKRPWQSEQAQLARENSDATHGVSLEAPGRRAGLRFPLDFLGEVLFERIIRVGSPVVRGFAVPGSGVVSEHFPP